MHPGCVLGFMQSTDAGSFVGRRDERSMRGPALDLLTDAPVSCLDFMVAPFSLHF